MALSILTGSSAWSSAMASASNEGQESDETPKSMTNADACLVIIGASYAGAWPIDELLGCKVINAGIDGNQSFEMEQRFDDDVIAHDPEYVLIWGFINDIFRADPEKMDAALQRIREGFEAMVTRARQQGIKPVVATEITIREQAGWDKRIMGMIGRLMGKTSYQSFINGHVMSTNQWLRGYAREQGLQLLDLEKLLADEDGSRQAPYATDDGSHLTDAAYRAMTQYARKQLVRQ